MPARRFSLLVIGATLCMVAGSWLLAWWLQPLYGDLTRLGGYAERHYGWNQPVEEFDPLITSFGEWKRPVDILVIGDSFANLRPAQQWQNHLAARTGWTIHTLDVHHVDVDALVGSPLYRASPPKVVIWNVIERDLVDEYGRKDIGCPEVTGSPAVALDPPRAGAAPIESRDRPRSLLETNPGFARTWLYHNALRAVVGFSFDKTERVYLTRPDLFSSRRPDELLVYSRDENKWRWRDHDLIRVRCSIEALATRFQANGTTVFVTALAPDKSSAYRAVVREQDRLPPAGLKRLLETFPVPDAQLDGAILDAVSRGVQDIYMPNDTHWSAPGHKLAAEAIFTLLEALRHARTGKQG